MKEDKGYWYAIRLSKTHKGTAIKLLSRRFEEEGEAKHHTKYCKSTAERKNKNHTYTIMFSNGLED